MAKTPEYEVPYQFGLAGHEDTYQMAVDLYLESVLARVKEGHALRDIIAADAMKSIKWKASNRRY
jgi:hypothetical protein